MSEKSTVRISVCEKSVKETRQRFLCILSRMGVGRVANDYSPLKNNLLRNASQGLGIGGL